jgi:organic radical activating enzyme
MEISMVQGKSFTSNTTKLLKHLDKLELIQNGKVPSPVMVHMSICNPCNLTCSFCCFANRAMKEILSLDRIKLALDQYKELGATGLELTGGGEPSLHPQFDEIVRHAHSLGFAIGICTNGTKLTKWKDLWQYFAYVRLGMYGFDEGYDYDLSVFQGLKTKVSAAYVWDFNTDTSTNPNITGEWKDKSYKKLSANRQKEENFYRMLDWVEKNKIPTRIAFNAIKSPDEVLKDIEQIKLLIKNRDLKYAFLSDFNYKPTRRNDHCYMHMVKPFVFTDGSVYVCPSSELSVENSYNMNPEFKICDVEGISNYYKSLEGGAEISMRHHACKFCKYALQNELVDDICEKTENNEFA